MVNSILYKYAPLTVCSVNAPLTQITKKIQKTYSKPWLKGILTSKTKIKYTKIFVKQKRPK